MQGGVLMDQQMMLKFLMEALNKMDDQEIDNALVRLKGMVSPQDYEKISALIAEKRKK